MEGVLQQSNSKLTKMQINCDKVCVEGIGHALFTGLEQREVLLGMTTLWVPRNSLQPNTQVFNLLGIFVLLVATI